MREVSFYAGVGYPIVVAIDRLEPEKIGSLTLGKLMRVAMLLECAPTDLIPFLNTTVQRRGKYKNVGADKRDRKNKSMKRKMEGCDF
jgi:hypothetical protein